MDPEHLKDLEPLLNWFSTQKWEPWDFQLQAWTAYLSGQSGLITVPTGAGKTYAAFLGPLAKLHRDKKKGLQILYITPLRSLSYDLEQALRRPIEALQWPYRVETRTGDTTVSKRNNQLKRPPEILLTTPESLAIMLSHGDAQKTFAALESVIIDEWHELLGSKRGILLELGLARLRKWNPSLQTWGVSATIGNLAEAAQSCVGNQLKPVIIQAEMKRDVIIDPILPENFEEIPWAGQFGLKMLPWVIGKLDPKKSTLIFTNTRAQAERWFRAIFEAKPEWQHLLRLHHSAIDQEERRDVEVGIKNGSYKLVVCTSSLDLGVDFPHVERVLQIGSPKSIARLIQRAGRSVHRPLHPCHVMILPTFTLHLAEIGALRLALEDKKVESRLPLKNCYDVLIQHLMTCAVSQGFTLDEIYEEIKTAWSYTELSLAELQWCLQFLTLGGKALTAYPEYKKVLEKEGVYQVVDKRIAMRHRLSIGTITSNMVVHLRFARGGKIGTIEENFINKLDKGDIFFFGGKLLELIQFRDGIAYVRLAKEKSQLTPVWQGTKLPFSAPLGAYMRRLFDLGHQAHFKGEEASYIHCLFELQQKRSHLPYQNELLVEILFSREGMHLFIYPFEGKLVHEGLAALMAYRLSQLQKGTFIISSNDYGFEILFSQEILIDEKRLRRLFSVGHLQEDIEDSLNLHEMAKGAFRDIARIAGLVFSGYPSAHKTHRQLQVSASLLFEVFSKYDPDNLLLKQAYQEVLEQQFEFQHLHSTLERLSQSKIILKRTSRFTPFALPLYIERTSAKLSNESLMERIAKITKGWEK